MENLIVSIIIPVYNVEQYIERCLDSVINQTYRFLDIILIDDGSSDLSGNICDKYASEDSRVRVIHQGNGGVSKARNVGLVEAKGEYCCFIDADDTIEKNMIFMAVEEAIKSGSEVIMYGHDKIYPNGERKVFIPNLFKSFFEGDEIRAFLLPEMIYSSDDNSNLWLSCSTNMYKVKGLLDEGFMFYDINDIYSEDAFATLQLFKNVNKVSILPYCFYHYYQNEKSQSHSLNDKRCLAIANLYNKSKKLYEGTLYEAVINSRLPGTMLNLLIGTLKVIAKSDYVNKYEIINKIIKMDPIQEIVYNINKKEEAIKRRIFIVCIKKKWVLMSWLLSYVAR